LATRFCQASNLLRTVDTDKENTNIHFSNNTTSQLHNQSKGWRGKKTQIKCKELTLEEAFPPPVPLVEPVWETLLLVLNNIVKFFIVAETAMALIKHTAGVATRINRTMTPAKYMLVRPYITMNIVASDSRLKQKYRPAGKRKSRMWKSNMKDDQAVG
jgi:hypothetical protein